MFLPALQDCLDIVAANPAFETTSFTIGADRIHNFGYRLPGYMDFEEPIPGSALQAHELRGLTFVELADGSVERYLMLRKFHALNQTRGHMEKDVAGKRIISVSEKLDGSVVRFIPLHGKLLARTKSSFTGPHAKMATELLEFTAGLRDFLTEAHSRGLAPVFEMVSPQTRIIVPYGEASLTLIQLRDEATGDYLDIASHPLVKKYSVRNASVPGVHTMSSVKSMQADIKGVEGLVVMFDDGTLMKCKTRWYDDFHDFFFEKNRTPKKMINMVLAETMDDALAAMDADDPARIPAQEVYDLVGAHINATAAAISAAVAEFTGDPADTIAKRAFAAVHKDDKLLGLYMQALRDTSQAGVMSLAKMSVQTSCRRDEDALKFLNRLREAARNAVPRM